MLLLFATVFDVSTSFFSATAFAVRSAFLGVPCDALGLQTSIDLHQKTIENIRTITDGIDLSLKSGHLFRKEIILSR